MAHVSFAHDDRPPIDKTLEGIADGAASLEKPIRCRFQPDLYDYGRSAYTTWHGLTWTIEVRDVEEGRRLREGLTAFFRVFGGDAKQQKAMLGTLRKLEAEARG